MADQKPVQNTPVVATPATAPAVETAASPEVVSPVAPAPSPSAPKGPRWRVMTDDGHVGEVTAPNKDVAKYTFMREKKICDQKQVWTITQI